MLEAAIDLVLKWHRGQIRDSSINNKPLPFLIHPLSVMKRVWKWGFATPIIMDACICHDIKEDTEITWEELRKVIGDKATDIVDELTYEGNTPEEKAEYIKSFRDKSIEALVIKIADRLDNVEDFILILKYSYSIEYFDKAANLFETLLNRKKELDIEVWNKINKDIDSIRFMLNKR